MSTTGPLGPLEAGDMTPAQQEAVATISSGPRGALIGPFVPLLHNPELMTRVQKIGEHLRFESELAADVLETAILTTARHWDQPFEWGYHHPLAVAAGVPADLIDDIGAGRVAAHGPAHLRAVQRLGASLLATGAADPESWELLGAELTSAALTELVVVFGYYTTLALVMNAARTPAEPGMAELPARAS
ncbi:MAG: hypothetical protein Q7T56_19890 [Nocardioidaceae bacterium]|nr:hypothetical protein [Nocardioidaceae bacterium]